jgi:PAS domain S-box-containing protein
MPQGQPGPGLPAEQQRLLHSLQVHQVELEMQNESLREAEAEITALQEYYFDLFDIAPVAYVTISEGLVLEANLTACNLLGLGRDALIGQAMTRFIFGGDQDLYDRHGRRAMATGSPQEGDLRMVSREGRCFWAHLVASSRTGVPGNPRFSHGASVNSLLFSDITGRKRMEGDLRAADLRKDELLATLEAFKRALDEHAIVAITDAAGRITYVNDKFCAISGFAREELLGQDHRINNGGGHPKAFFADLWDTILAGRVWKGEIRNKAKDGTIYWVDTTLVPFLGPDGRPFQFVAIRADITVRKQAEEALLEADRRKDEYLATLAHELRNPLAPIRTGAYVLGLQSTLEPGDRQIVNLIAHQAAQMARLVDDLLDVSRISRGRLELRKETVELETVVARAVEACGPLIEAGRLQLTLDLPRPLPILEADPARLEQMVLNLLNNACKYTPPGGHIQISACQEELEAVLRVRDDGVGMTADELSHTFDLFYQAGQTLDHRSGGMGIGLALVHQLAQLHGGRVLARSGGLGLGSEFTLRLPVPAAATLPLPPPAPAAPTGSPGRKHVLIIDDDPSVRTTCGMLLEAMGFAVTLAPNGVKGVEQAKALHPAIAIIDLCMPGMDGLEAAKRIREDLGQAIHLVALSGFSREVDRAKSKAAGFDQHLVKSGDPLELLDLLRKIP